MNISYLYPLLTAAVLALFFIYFKWYIKRRTSDSILSEHRIEASRLILEIDSVTDRDVQLIEDRVKKLKAILEETDKRISVYTRELERSRTGEALYTSLGRGIRAALNTHAETPAQEKKPAEPPAAAQPIQSVQTAAKPPSKPESEAGAQSKTASRRHIRLQIDELAGQGLAAEEIASRLNISRAEVELAMNLSKRGAK